MYDVLEYHVRTCCVSWFGKDVYERGVLLCEMRFVPGLTLGSVLVVIQDKEIY